MSADELASELKTRGVKSEDLDRLVHDIATDIASDVNESGLHNQITWLMQQGLSAEEILEYLDENIEN